MVWRLAVCCMWIGCIERRLGYTKSKTCTKGAVQWMVHSCCSMAVLPHGLSFFDFYLNIIAALPPLQGTFDELSNNVVPLLLRHYIRACSTLSLSSLGL